MNILIPDSWLREYLETDATVKQIKDCLSLCGPSVEKITQIGNDHVYDIEITSNRVDMASVYGIAREARSILPRFQIPTTLKKLELILPQAPSKILPMDISDPERNCNRILGIVMEVDPKKPTPLYIKERLEKSGVRSLNSLVDITNYVMLEIGHPCHVFDYDRVKTQKFIIRRAKKNEPIVTLDDKKYLLDEEDVIIDDGTGRVIDLPGIMGTENSVVTSKTHRIIFFIESNNPVLIRKTSMRYGIRTMAAAINEKHPDPELSYQAMLRGIELYEKVAGGIVCGNIIDIYPNRTKPVAIKTTVDFINERLGIALRKEEICKILESLSFDVIPSHRDDTLIITPPSFRQFDVTIPEDIVEEVARIYGYHNLPSSLMEGNIPISDKPKNLPIEFKIKTMLKYWGLTEIYSYSFISKELIEKCGLSLKSHLKISNPLTSDVEYMRISLVPSMLETIRKNQYFSENLFLFELANIYLSKDKDLPDEKPMLLIAGNKSFAHVKGISDSLFHELNITNYKTFTESGHFFHPKQTIKYKIEGKTLALIGKINPLLFSRFDINKDISAAEIDLTLLSEMANTVRIYTPISPYPPVIEDLTFDIDANIKKGEVIEQIYGTSKYIQKAELTDSFNNSMTIRITYHDNTKNLGTGDVKIIRNRILDQISDKFGISLRKNPK